MSIYLICIVIVLHFIFDWILQPRKIAKLKGSTPDGFDAVLIHMLINILPFSFLIGLALVLMTDMKYTTIQAVLAINFISHFIIDVMLPKGNNERQMINWTAIDQILHLTILFILLNLQ